MPPLRRILLALALLCTRPVAVSADDSLPWCPPPGGEIATTVADAPHVEVEDDGVCPEDVDGRSEVGANFPDVWSVITRGLPEVGRMPARVNPGVERLDADGCWRRAGLDGLLANPRQPLLIFVHGNRYEHDSAREQGLLLARRVRASCPEAADVRTVIFSWPSDKQGILLRDSRVKYERALTEGHYLAWLLAKVEPDRPVALVGYSYGSLIALEALEDLVHAEWKGRADVQPWIDREAPLHLVLVAAAVRQDALSPRGPYRETLPCVDRLTILYNSDDIALRFFEHVDRRLSTEALGHEGMPAGWVPGGIGFGQIDAAPIVGPSHRFRNYLASPSLMRRICAGAGRGLCCPPTPKGADACECVEADDACPCDLDAAPIAR